MATLLGVFLVGTAAAALGNAAAYEWAYDRRRISPWQPNPAGVVPRGWLDRVPVVGWLRLRRDSRVLGRGFWVRPLLIEVAFGAALAALWWWESSPVLALVDPQPLAEWPCGGYAVWPAFVAHSVLAWLMLVASVIDCDEKTIPDAVTLPGTLLGLVLMTLLPMAPPPNVEARLVPPTIGVELTGLKGHPTVGPDGGTVYAEPTHAAAPDDWPDWLAGGTSRRGSLALGLGLYAFWVFALTDRRWDGRRGARVGAALMARRVGRGLTTSPLRETLLAGSLGIATVWFAGGSPWQGLLSALVGMIASGSMVWAVRIVGSAALGREAMGFGDVTLMFLVGAFLGWQGGLLVFFLAPFAGLVVGLLQLLLRRDDVIPYGPFLCLAACFVVVRWGTLWPRVEGMFALGPVVPVVLIVCLLLLGLMLAAWRQFKLRVLGMTEAWQAD